MQQGCLIDGWNGRAVIEWIFSGTGNINLRLTLPVRTEYTHALVSRILFEFVLDEPVQPVVALPQIHRRRVREHANRPTRREDHANARSSAIASASVIPSTL